MIKRIKAFTIIEVMVVVVVIGILSTALIGGISSYLKNANDARKSAQITVIAEALEKYYDENGEYPSCTAMTQTPSTIATNTLIGIKTDAFQAPGGSTNSITCDLGSSDSLLTTLSPNLLENYSGYDLLFCRYASDCSGISGISADFSYQVAFTAKAGSKYEVAMVQIDNTSTSWISGTQITSNITYSTPTSGASLSNNIITTTNAGETRVTFTGAAPRDKTVFVKITEVDSSNVAISPTAYTKALGAYTTVGSYTLSSPASGSVKYLVVAGGGGGYGGTGCCVGGGGGGAGGLLSGNLSVQYSTYSITVGNGIYQSNGESSSLSTLTATGGGRGGAYNSVSASNGGSGGGAVYSATTAGTGTSGQGNAGGAYVTVGSEPGGGSGGGAGSAGQQTQGTVATIGGIGLQNSISGSNIYYAGGGGGAVRNNYGSVLAGGAGGLGGGGKGSDSNANNATNGTANTGGGGGGGYGNSGGNGSTGGSGVVIIRLQ